MGKFVPTALWNISNTEEIVPILKNSLFFFFITSDDLAQICLFYCFSVPSLQLLSVAERDSCLAFGS